VLIWELSEKARLAMSIMCQSVPKIHLVGPYNYDLTQTLIRISQQHNIEYKVDIFPHYWSDGSGALRAGEDIRIVLLGPGISASHGYERTHIDALKNTAQLLWKFISQECLE
jgi:putative aminopeptidase FrvX